MILLHCETTVIPAIKVATMDTATLPDLNAAEAAHADELRDREPPGPTKFDLTRPAHSRMSSKSHCRVAYGCFSRMALHVERG